ncbi:DNA topoisomerase IB [Nodosilinea nodulosa]|uniref:DNA topoisomerase IB n=1 Tax=Nodosilinea nodulosa TaxID=416001 RepID=UPI0002EFAD17|nr:DNA topoisomerase IB [Nodosilinea nodulosa]
MNQEPKQIARQSGLRYVTDQQPGLTRKKSGRGFSYFDVNGELIRDRSERDRIQKIVIPPAWEDVWICPFEDGHLQATGRDAKGRKQYRYHTDWQRIRNLAKFDRMIPFGEALSDIRQQTNKHLKLEGLPREKVLALVVRLLETTLIRVGNVAYARSNQSYGLTTLRTRHVTIEGHQVNFEFTGKSGVEHSIELADRRLTKIIKQCYEIPGYTVFQYFDDDGNKQQVDSGDVNDYLQHITGEDFTAKEFRTWAGTTLAAQELTAMALRQAEAPDSKQVTAAIKAVAKQLGNRPATCRKYYVHPRVPEIYLAGELVPLMQATCETIKHLDPHECAVLKLLTS